MTVTLAAEVGDASASSSCPRHDGEYGSVGTVAEVVERQPPGRLNARHPHRACTAGEPARPSPAPTAAARRGRPSGPTTRPADKRVRELESEYRAVVDEILDLRGDDGRIAAFLRSISEPGELADTAGYSPRSHASSTSGELLEAVDVTERLELAVAPAARAARRAAGAQAHPRRRRVRRAEAAARVLPAQADGVDPQGARRGRRDRSSRNIARRSPSRGCPTPCASRPSASSAGSSAWARATARRR